MQDSLINDGLNLMFTGMGTVVLFLAVLVVLTKLMSGFISRFLPEPEPVAAPTPKPVNSGSSSTPVNATTLKVIAAAVKAHRNKRGRA